MKNRIRTVAAGCAGMLATVCAAGAGAQAYPAKPLRLLVTYAPGGASDIVSRLLAAQLSDSLRQQVIVDNRPGASGIIASELLVRSPADGYTIINVNVAHGANPALNAKLPYDTAKDFASVSLLALLPTILVVHPSLPVRSVRQLVAFARARPGELNYASASIWGPTHLVPELFKSVAGIDLRPIHYKGAAPAAVGVLSGEAQAIFASVTALMPHVRSKRLVALASTAPARSTVAPELPTFAELGYPGVEAPSGYSIVAPAATPREVIARLGEEQARVAAMPDYREALQRQGFEPQSSTPGEFAAFLRAEYEKWGKVIRRLKGEGERRKD